MRRRPMLLTPLCPKVLCVQIPPYTHTRDSTYSSSPIGVQCIFVAESFTLQFFSALSRVFSSGSSVFILSLRKRLSPTCSKSVCCPDSLFRSFSFFSVFLCRFLRGAAQCFFSETLQCFTSFSSPISCQFLSCPCFRGCCLASSRICKPLVCSIKSSCNSVYYSMFSYFPTLVLYACHFSE